ncbi:MAG: nuclear transport factor 2 family protein [Caulobacterales bacterium]
MTDAAAIAQRYIEAWNEKNPERRRTLIAGLWTEDASFVDPVMSGDGHAGIDAVIEGVQNRFPDYRFNLVGQADSFGDHLRLSWALGPGEGDAPVKGTDFATLQDGRLKVVTGFFDQIPG